MDTKSEEFHQLKRYLDEQATRINNPAFIGNDPVQFPRRFSNERDIEISAFLCATIAWGNRTMICRNCEKLLSIMDNQPANYVDDRAYEDIPDDFNIHRTFFGRNLKHYLRGLNAIYSRYPSIDAFAKAHNVGASETPAWELVKLMSHEMAEANSALKCDSRCLPGNLDNTALKRINMALRWLVRRDGIVDLGTWDSITPAQLFIPLDVHVGDTARALNMTSRKANDKRTVMEITDLLRAMRPDDPVIYDFALFGIGMGSKALG